MQRKRASGGTLNGLPPIVNDVLQTPGQPLSSDARAMMEPHFGHDFSQVRVHTDTKAAASARAVNALAYTVGRNVAFDTGQYAPSRDAGKRLLAHELAHVVQQSSGTLVAAPSEGRLEAEADQAASSLGTSSGAGELAASALRLSRQPAAADQQRISQVSAEYLAAFNRRDWKRAALLLNDYSDEIIRSRIQAMNHDQKVQMFAGAVLSLPESHGRVTYPISITDMEASRVGELTADYLAAVEGHNWPRAAELLNAFNDIDVRSMVAELMPADLPSLRSGAGDRFSRVSGAVDALDRTRRQAVALARIRAIRNNVSVEGAAEAIDTAVVGLDMHARGVQEAVIRAVTDTFRADSGPILGAFFARLEARIQKQPTAADEARMNRTIAGLQIQPRGPYKQLGPGVVFPTIANAARPLLPAVQAIQNGFSGAGAFISGVVEGLSGSLNEEQRTAFANRLLDSELLTMVFPPVFLAGTVVGIAEDVIDIVKGVYHLITNLGEFFDGIKTLVTTLISPESAAIGHNVGILMGQTYGAKLAAMARQNVFEFTYNLGRIIGPTIVYTVLTFIGAPEVAAAAIVEKLLPLLRPLLQRFPALLRLAERMAVALRERSAATILGRELEAKRLAAARLASLETILARVRAAVRSGSIVTHTFEEAVAKNLATEGVGLAEVMASLPSGPAGEELRELYRIAYNGMNNRDIWEAVLGDISREAQTVGPGAFSHPKITSPNTQAAWNLSQRAAGPGSQIFVTPAENVTINFIGERIPFGPRFFDVNIGSASHGMSTHMVQDLVVDRAFKNAGKSITAEQFRGRLGAVAVKGPGGRSMPTLLWNALYDSTEGQGHLTSPETAIKVMREGLGAID